MKLGDVTEIIGGQNMTRISAENYAGSILKNVKVMLPKAIVDGMVIEKDLGDAEIVKEIDADKYTQEGDIVIKLSSPYDSALISSEQAGIAIPSFCAVIRVKEGEYDRRYLTAVLNTEVVRKGLAARVAGSIRPMIRISDLKDLDLPMINKEDMEAIGKAYLLSGKKRQILQEMANIEKELMENVICISMGGEREHE